MNDDKKAGLMREFSGAFESGDIEKSLSLCADDIVWETPLGTFKGKEELKRYLTWNTERIKNAKLTDTGNGILVHGDRASYEHSFSGTIDGEQVSFLMFCMYEFSDDKIQRLRTVFDRMSIAEQASSKWLPKKIVNTVVNQIQKGLVRN